MMTRTRSAAFRALTCVAIAVSGVPFAGCKGSGSEGGDAGSASSTPSAQADVHLPGIDTSPLTMRERKEFSEYVSELPSPCSDVAVPIAQCITEKRNCLKCMPAARFIVKAVRLGGTRDQIEHAYKNRYDPATLKTIPIDNSPVEGPSDALVTIAEFADFECPACQAMEPVIERIMAERKGKVRLIYKFMALSMHPRAEPAARAAIAALAQGQDKFWQYHDRLFQTRLLEPTDLDKDARALGLDLVKFAKDETSPETTDRLARDQKLFDEVHADHTPTLYVNGREIDAQDVEEWVGEELGESGKPPSASDAGASDAAAGVSDAGAGDAAPGASAASADAAATKGK